MDIQKAFSNNKQALDNLVETIVLSAIGDNISPPSKTDVDEAFARLEAAVRILSDPKFDCYYEYFSSTQILGNMQRSLAILNL